MKKISDKLTQYVIKSGVVSPESYAVYQYGFQVGLELLSSFAICCIVAILLNMFLEFIIFTVIFIVLRTFAGGVHLEKFTSCLFCSVSVQTLVLFLYNSIKAPISISWVLILVCSIALVNNSPVESENKELSLSEKRLLKKTTKKIILSIILFSIMCSFYGNDSIVFLVALTLLVVMLSQYIGMIKYCVNKDN